MNPLITSALTMFFTICVAPSAGRCVSRASTEIGAEAANELSVEEMEKAAYTFATSHKCLWV